MDAGTADGGTSDGGGECPGGCAAGEGCCDGTCMPLDTAERCGACDRACATGELCEVGASGSSCVTECSGGRMACGDSCVDITTDPNHCNGCGMGCPVPANGTAGCTDSTCGASCDSGFGDCNDDADEPGGDGCETDTETSVDHCGACDQPCPTAANATPTCATGTCGFTCDAGFDDCDGDPANGCEADLSAPDSCGSCALQCVAPRPLCDTSGTPTCLDDCASGTTLCGASCVDTATNVSHCNGCDMACPDRANASRTCVSSACGIQCDAGFDDCDNDTATGCETNLGTDVDHCGSCANSCPNAMNATRTCTVTGCGYTCTSGFADCDFLPGNGCEIDTRTSLANCNGCGMACDSERADSCAGGACRCGAAAACGATERCCGGACVPRYPNNCTACGTACDTLRADSCSTAGACRCGTGAACSASQRCCTGSCVARYPGNCAACGATCDANRADNCSTGGACQCGTNAQCNTNERCCGGSCVARYPNNCASCGNMCPSDRADNCSTGGACQCGATGALCSATERCCGGACVPRSPSNCTACGSGCYFNKMFVTSTTYTPGLLGGLAGADAACRARATAGGFMNPNNFVAFLGSFSGANAVTAWSRLSGFRGWQRRDGTAFADTVADMMAGRTFYPPMMNELGNLVAADTPVLTAPNGGVGDATCQNWTSTAGPSVTVGYANVQAGNWVGTSSRACNDTTVHLYCFELTGTEAVAPPVPPTARYAFLSAGNFSPSSGIAAADTICTNEAAAAGRTGTWRALLAPSGATPASRFSTGGAPWYRTDNVRLASTAANFMAGGSLEAGLCVRANGTTMEQALTWTGASAVNVAGTATSTCGNWATTGSGATHTYPLAVEPNWFGRFTSGNCANAERVLCLQQ